MFTGLIEATGEVARVDRRSSAARLRIATGLGAELTDGESIAVDGVCLTVAAADAEGFEADLSPETLQVTNLSGAEAGARVNLERAVRADARLGGHFVLGHVDGVGRVHVLRPDGDHDWLAIDVPAALTASVVSRGSIAVDGVSLTVAALEGQRLSFQIVPFTLAHTTLGDVRAGDLVNLETDVIGKYVARVLAETGAGGRQETARE